MWKKTALVANVSSGTILYTTIMFSQKWYETNWKVSNVLMGKRKNNSSQAFSVDRVSTNDTAEFCKCFYNNFTDHPRNVHESIQSNVSYKEGDVIDIYLKLPITCKSHIVYHLTDLINFSITPDVYAGIFKVFKITSFHKKCSSFDISSYRPFSVFSNLSNLFENIIDNRLQNFLQNIQSFRLKSSRFP